MNAAGFARSHRATMSRRYRAPLERVDGGPPVPTAARDRPAALPTSPGAPRHRADRIAEPRPLSSPAYPAGPASATTRHRDNFLSEHMWMQPSTGNCLSDQLRACVASEEADPQDHRDHPIPTCACSWIPSTTSNCVAPARHTPTMIYSRRFRGPGRRCRRRHLPPPAALRPAADSFGADPRPPHHRRRATVPARAGRGHTGLGRLVTKLLDAPRRTIRPLAAHAHCDRSLNLDRTAGHGGKSASTSDRRAVPCRRRLHDP